LVHLLKQGEEQRQQFLVIEQRREDAVHLTAEHLRMALICA
jgi:hypothetical protein